MKKFALLAAVLLLLPMLLPIAAETIQSDITADVLTPQELYYEDHVTNSKLDQLTANNDNTNKYQGRSPLDNLYDLDIVGTGHTSFADYTVTSKNLVLQGNHQSETTSKNVFSMSNQKDPNPGKGLVTVIPSSVMKGLDNFTVSYLERQYTPSGKFGLALFYQGYTENGITYFNGYDNFAFSGFSGTNFKNYETYALYGGKQTDFECETMTAGHKPKKNASVYVSVECTKGSYEVDGVTYTARIDSYVDDFLISSSYAQWNDAPVMFYYETQSTRYDVQFTNIRLTSNQKTATPIEDALPLIQPVEITGTSVRYEGGSGLRFYMTLKKESAYEQASDTETGVILLESSKYQGTLTLETADILRSAAPREVADISASVTKNSYAFTDSDVLSGKTFYARGYIRYTIQGHDFYYYTDIERASCARTAAKVVASVETMSSTEAMLSACRKIAGNVTTVQAMSFNVLTSKTKDTSKYGTLTDAQRTDAAIEMFLELRPDVIGLQEVSDAIYEMYCESKELMDIYEIVGSGAHKESGEGGLYILYRKDRFELVKQGVKYLSAEPDTPHSLFPEAVDGNTKGCSFFPRKAVYVVLRDKETNAEFAYCDIHLSYNGKVEEYADIAETLRRLQMQKLVDLIKDGSMFGSDIPFVVAGDFNAKPNSVPYTTLMELADDMRYMADVAPAADQGTLHSYESGNTFIDHMFISHNDFYATELQFIRDEYKGILPSDHYPVLGTFTVLPY